MSKSYKKSRNDERDLLHDKSYLEYAAKKEFAQQRDLWQKLKDYLKLKGEID